MRVLLLSLPGLPVGRLKVLKVAGNADGEDRDVSAGGQGFIYETGIYDLFVLGELFNATIAGNEIFWLGL